jgi:hypothetical protein
MSRLNSRGSAPCAAALAKATTNGHNNGTGDLRRWAVPPGRGRPLSSNSHLPEREPRIRDCTCDGVRTRRLEKTPNRIQEAVVLGDVLVQEREFAGVGANIALLQARSRAPSRPQSVRKNRTKRHCRGDGVRMVDERACSTAPPSPLFSPSRSVPPLYHLRLRGKGSIACQPGPSLFSARNVQGSCGGV